MRLRQFFLIWALFSIVGCGSSSDAGKTIGADEVSYRVTITSLWNATDHVSVPGSAHFTNFVPVVHNSSYSMFEVGVLATPGLISLAETGAVAAVSSELESAVLAGSVLRSSVEDDLFLNTGKTQVVFEISVGMSHPLVSFASMIAPSPDWIVGQDSLELYTESGGFVTDTGVIDLFAYNAGSRDGDTAGNFSLGGVLTSPQAPMSRLNGAGFSEPFATVQFEKK